MILDSRAWIEISKFKEDGSGYVVYFCYNKGSNQGDENIFLEFAPNIDMAMDIARAFKKLLINVDIKVWR